MAREQVAEVLAVAAADEVGADDLHGTDRGLEGRLVVDQQTDAEGRHRRDHVIGRFVIVVAEDRDAAVGDRTEGRERFLEAARRAHALHREEVPGQRHEVGVAPDEILDPRP